MMLYSILKLYINQRDNMKILIFGMGKTGSTALAYGVKDKLHNHELIFEPSSLNSIDYSKENLIVKSLNIINWQTEKDYFSKFERKILLIRHPYDRLISYILYAPHNGLGFSNDYTTSQYIELIKQKVQEPTSISTIKITKFFKDITTLDIIEVCKREYEKLLMLYKEKSQHKFFQLKYEDFIDSNTKELENYLGIVLNTNIEVASQVKRVERSKKYGEWQDWLTQEDLSQLNDIFSRFLDEFNYPKNLDFDRSRHINPKHSYLYTIRVINDYRKIHSLPEYQCGKIVIGEEGKIIDIAIDKLRNKNTSQVEENISQAVKMNPNLQNACYQLEKRFVNLRRQSQHQKITPIPQSELIIQAVLKDRIKVPTAKIQYIYYPYVKGLEIQKIIRLCPENNDFLQAYVVDLPTQGQQLLTSNLELRGWVLGKNSPVVKIELILNNNIIAEIPVDKNRPGVAQHYPEIKEAEMCGFQTEVDFSKLKHQ